MFALARDLLVMGHYQHGRAGWPAVHQRVHNVGRAVLVELARWLVGKDEGASGSEGPSHSQPLQLAA